MSLLTCENLTVSYGSKIAIDSINISIEDGDYLCILGENGSGKTTLVKTLLGIQKKESGKISFGEGLKQNQIGYLPQQQNIKKDFPATVWEVALSGNTNALSLFPFFSESHKNRTIENLKKLEIYNLKDRSFSELSGGQQQRVLLARALCATKKLLILDEPTSALDAIAKDELYALISKLNVEEKLTIVMINHDSLCAKKYANKILHLATKQIFFGSKSDYLNSEIGKKFFKEKLC